MEAQANKSKREIASVIKTRNDDKEEKKEAERDEAEQNLQSQVCARQLQFDFHGNDGFVCFFTFISLIEFFFFFCYSGPVIHFCDGPPRCAISFCVAPVTQSDAMCNGLDGFVME